MFGKSLINQKTFLLAFFAIIFVFFMQYRIKIEKKSEEKDIDVENGEIDNTINIAKINTVKVDDKAKYYENCYSLFKKMRFPNKSLIIRPPPREPPADMKADFEQNGDMPIKKWYYFNDAFSDSSSDRTDFIPLVPNGAILDIIQKVKTGQSYGTYGDSVMEKCFKDYHQSIKNKSMVVIGTINPWIESIAVMYDASHITTLDYTRKRYERPNMDWIHVNDYLDNVLQSRKFETFDYSASFSSIEHSGLGRFGDPLSPYGDVEAMQQVHCMLKPNGLFFLGLPVSDDNSSYIEFNAHRIYGTKRLELLFKGWQLLDNRKSDAFENRIFILRKL